MDEEWTRTKIGQGEAFAGLSAPSFKMRGVEREEETERWAQKPPVPRVPDETMHAFWTKALPGA